MTNECYCTYYIAKPELLGYNSKKWNINKIIDNSEQKVYFQKR